MWRRLIRARPYEVSLEHVRSHVKVPGNELADALADLGRGGGGVDVAWATQWLRRWLAAEGLGVPQPTDAVGVG